MNSTKNFEVGGLLLSMSAQGVERQLSRLPGVTAVQVSHLADSANVTYNPDQVDVIGGISIQLLIPWSLGRDHSAAESPVAPGDRAALRRRRCVRAVGLSA